MSELLALPSPAGHIRTPYDNLLEMKLIRLQFMARRKQLRRQYKELKGYYDSEDAADTFLEQWESIELTILGACEDLDVYTAHLDEEINKVIKGILIMETLENASGKEALNNYIVADTELSIPNLIKAKDTYDSIIRSVSSICKNTHNE